MEIPIWLHNVGAEFVALWQYTRTAAGILAALAFVLGGVLLH